MSYESSLSEICPPNSDSFTWKVLKYWKDFRSACKTFCNTSNDEDHLDTVTKFTEDEFSELISVILDRFMTSSKTTLVNSDGIISYYFFKALLDPHKCIESESEKDIITDEQNSLAQNALKMFFSQFFFKIGRVLDTALEDSETAKAFPICICIEFISDILKDNSSTVLLLYHLSELWNKLGSIIKELVEHIIVDQNGKANNDQEVFLFEVFRLWRSALKACTTVDDKKMDNTRDCAFTVLVEVLHVCLIEYFTKYSKFLVDVSSSIWPVFFIRSLRTLYKLVYKSDHLWVNNLHPIVNKLIYELLCSYSRSRKSKREISDSNAFCDCLVTHIVRTIKAQKIKSDEVSLLEPDTCLSLRIIILCGLESALKLDPNDLQLWSILSSIHELLMDIELGESNMVHSYENSIIILFSEDDAQLFRVLDLWIQIEDHIKSTE
ncbi:unnamed protein product [Schistosoma bovis]|nr:unnamed protein product [Schistosoma bovis]